MTTAVGRFGRGIAENVILGLIIGDPLQATQQIVGINDDKAARSLGQFVKDLLVGSNIRILGNDLPGLIVLIGPINLAWVGYTGSAAAAAPRPSSIGSTGGPAGVTTSSTAASSATVASASTASSAAMLWIKISELERIKCVARSGVGKSRGRQLAGDRMPGRWHERTLRR